MAEDQCEVGRSRQEHGRIEMIKVTSSETPEKKERPFPKLMISNSSGLIVLMEAPGEGSTLTKSVGWPTIGRHHKHWDIDCFRDYNGSITLSNE